MHGWIEPFYEAAQPAVEPGHIWGGQPICLPPRHALKIDRLDPLDDGRLGVKVCGRTADTSDHPPVHSLRLGAGEAAVVAKARRDHPVIVLGGTTATELTPSSTEHAGTVMVVPIYAADRFDPHTRRRIAHYDFTNAFYLPALARPRFDEGFARLDHTQPVRRSLLQGHRAIKLAPDALDALIEWFVMFTTNRQIDDSLILDYRREQLAGP